MMSNNGWAWLWVFLGAGVGAWVRWQVGIWLNLPNAMLPWGTLMVNVIGGLLIGGLVSYWQLKGGDGQGGMLRLLWITGFLGGLTTFSTFSVESLMLLQHRQWGWFVLHTQLHVWGALGMAWVGFWGVRQLNG